MSFVVYGKDWNFNGLSNDQIIEMVDCVLSFVANSFSVGEEILVGDDFLQLKMIEDLTLWELTLPGEIRQELAAWMSRSPYYAEKNDWPEGIDSSEIAINGEEPLEDLDLAWVHHSVRNGKSMGCFSFLYNGLLETSSVSGSTKIRFVKSETDRAEFWQDSIVLQGDNKASLLMYAEKAYPNLFFHEAVLNDVDKLGGGYLAIRELVQKFLSILNLHAEWIFCRPPPTVGLNDEVRPDSIGKPSNALVQRRFRGFGAVVAPEKPNVRNDKRCREAREITLNDEVLYCEWHMKLEPHRNRIHIHPPTTESNNKTVVAIIDEHLPLP